MPLMYLTTESRGGVVLIAVRAGLFDQMPELGEGGPREAMWSAN